MSTLPKAERQFRFEQAKRRRDFLGGIEPARRLSKAEREETQRQYKLEQKGDYRHFVELYEAEKKPEASVPSRAEVAALRPAMVAKIAVGSFILKKNVEYIWHSVKTNQLPVRGQSLGDLIASDIPLDPDTRLWIANEVLRLCNPERQRNNPLLGKSPKARQQRKLWAARQIQIYCENFRGMTATAAEGVAAESIGLHVDALRQRRKRAHMRKQQGPRRPEFFHPA